jgi:integrase
MGRPATGSVIEDRRSADTGFGLRFTAYGQRRSVALGRRSKGWTRERADEELQNVLADVRRGIWQPPKRQPPVSDEREIPTFHEFASEWFERQKLEGGRRGGGLTKAGTADLLWRLSNHLLPVFKDVRIDAIRVEDVDAYRLAKVKAGQLNATSINKTLATLSAILETAVEYGWLTRNPAKGRRRRLPAVNPPRTWLDSAEQIAALLDGASALDAAARTRKGERRALLATLIFAGLRIGEALALRWADIDLARGTIRVRAAKTDAGVRTVNIVGALRDELSAFAAVAKRDQTALVFATSTGEPHGATNIRRRLLARAIEKANERLSTGENGEARQDVELISTKLTPHSLRRTFASILFALGETAAYVMAQMGHTTANLTLGIYAREMDRRDGEPERLRALVQGRATAGNGAGLGSESATTPLEGQEARS